MKKKSFLESLGLFLHPKFEFHLLIELVINLVTVVPVIGLFELFEYPLVTYANIIGVIIYIVVATFLMESLKVYILRHFINYIFKSKGIILFIIYGLIFYLTTFLIKDLMFNKNVLLNLFIFTVSFLILKILLIIVYQRLQTNKRGEEEWKSG